MNALRGKLIKGSGSWGKLIERSVEAGEDTWTTAPPRGSKGQVSLPIPPLIILIHL